MLGLVLGEVPGLRLLGLVFGEVPGLRLLGLVLGEVPGLRLLGLVFGEVPGLRLLGLVFGEVPGLRLLGLAVPAGVVIGAPTASLVTLLGLRGALGLPAAFGFGGAGGLAGLTGAAFWGVALVPHKLTKSKVVPPGVRRKQTGSSIRGFEALGNWDVPGMGRLKAASAISGIKAADKAAIVRNILISVSSNIELCLIQYCPEITKCLHSQSRSSFSSTNYTTLWLAATFRARKKYSLKKPRAPQSHPLTKSFDCRTRRLRVHGIREVGVC